MTFNRQRSVIVTNNPVSHTFWYPISYNRSYEKRDISDVVVPDFHRRSRRGELFFNPLLLEIEKMYLPDDVITHKSVGYEPYTPSGSSSAHYMRAILGYIPQDADFDTGNGSLPGPVVTLDESDEIELRKQASLAFVDSPQYDFGEDLFELRETIRFLKSPLSSIERLLKSFSKDVDNIPQLYGRARQQLYRAERIAELWATYSFALRPLIQSLDNAISAFYDSSTLPLRRTSRSKSTLSGTLSSNLSGTHLGSGNKGTATITNFRSIDFHVGLVYDAPQRGSITEKLGLRLKDLPKTLWEVFPLSFMIDRVVNIGNVVSSLINLSDANVKIRGGFVVRRSLSTHTVMLTSVTPPLGTTITAFSPLPHYHEKFSMTREAWLPSLSTGLRPLLNPRMLIKDLTSVADLIALIVLRAGPLARNLLK